jgi:hypothetical protein
VRVFGDEDSSITLMSIVRLGDAGELDLTDDTPDDWISSEPTTGDFQDALLWHRKSPAIAALSRAPASALDSVTFPQWLERFIDWVAAIHGLLNPIEH